MSVKQLIAALVYTAPAGSYCCLHFGCFAIRTGGRAAPSLVVPLLQMPRRNSRRCCSWRHFCSLVLGSRLTDASLVLSFPFHVLAALLFDSSFLFLFPSAEDIQFIYFDKETDLDVVQNRAAHILAAQKGCIFGGMYHVTDGAFFRQGVLDFNEVDFEEQLRQRLRRDNRLGLEYVNFQVHLPPRFQDTGGEYRDDVPFLQRTAERLSLLHRLCHEEGLNCYIETHVERVSEDVVAFADILTLATEPLEVTVDFSPYMSRGITRGRSF